MNTKICIGVFLIFSSFCFSQNTFLNKRNTLAIDANCNIPLLSGGFSSTSYKYGKDEMRNGKDWLDYGIGMKYTVSVSNRVSIGVLANYNLMHVSPEKQFGKNYMRNGNSQTSSYDVKMQDVGINQFTFMPVLEIFLKNGQSPVGFYHIIGIGYSLSQIQKGSYGYSISSAPVVLDETPSHNTPDYYNFQKEWKSYNSFSFLFGIGMKTPITKSLIFNYGVDFNANVFMKPSDELILENNDVLFNYENIYYNTRREQLFTIKLKAGLAFVF